MTFCSIIQKLLRNAEIDNGLQAGNEDIKVNLGKFLPAICFWALAIDVFWFKIISLDWILAYPSFVFKLYYLFAGIGKLNLGL